MARCGNIMRLHSHQKGSAEQCSSRDASLGAHCNPSCALVQFVYCGKKAALTIGNVKPLGDMPEGTIICNVEEVSA